MSVDLNPHVQLGFPRPLTQLVKRSLQVSNPNNQPVAFKVKTTAPKQYCVRPNSGRIEPGEKVEVQVLLQPMKEEPPTAAKCRDKFLVQSTIITPERETTSLQDIWGLVEKEDKSAIHEQKIRCAFLPATTAPVPEEGEDGMGSSMSNGGGDEKYATVQNGYNPVAAAQNASANTDGTSTEKARAAAVAAGGAAAAGAGAAYAATKNAGARAVGSAQQTASGGAGSADLSEKSQSELQNEVKRLQSQVESLRKQAAGAPASEGVPVHIVAAICFGVFAFTYLFL
ncbi:VAMP-associated protein [Acaromyces ingoldii]|uniref:VAMP-associated protein n=1 Tax=Acaromyces ingoldii TaxID=215250 RepID=A0A316YVM3_9BASI|nr:VAMP-associated protein [Acaromyces ingoldii]PWN93182.1 VAMP-associated protein [Acaromyces ingoldii]